MSLIDEFPKEGLQKLWQSEKIPAAGGAGWGSVSVADGRAYIFLNWKDKEPIATRTLTEQGLRRIGWFPEKLPEDLTKAVEAARSSPEREAAKQWNDVVKFARDWVDTKLSEEHKRFRGIVEDRLRRGSQALPFQMFDKLVAIKDRQFANQEELDKWFVENGINDELKKTIVPGVPTTRDIAKDVVLCLDAEKGETLWKTGLPGRPYADPCSSTPCIVDGRCLVLGSDASVYGLDAKTGDVIWKTKGKNNPGNSASSSFVVAEGVGVLVAGPLTGFDTKTGEVLWSIPKVSGSHNSAALWSHEGKVYVIANSDGDAACVDPEKGEVLWNVRGGGWSSVAVHGDTMAIFSPRGDVGLSAFKLSLTGAEKLWTQKFTDRGASPLIYNGHVYAIGGRGDAHAMCVELESGTVKWDEKVPGTEIASPAGVDGKVLCVVGSALYMIKATPENYTLLGSANLGIETCTSPAIVNGRVFLRLGNGVACYDLARKL
jgi:outer membrane protein assembly factor BamB